jgi:aminoglycoside phosphotransferase
MAPGGSDKPCSACGWSESKQSYCSYSSHVELFYGASERGVWSIGSNLVLKERPNLPPRNEVLNIQYLKNSTTIPVPSVVKEWVDDDNSYFILMERIKGQTLEQAWPALFAADKERIADQVAEFMLQLRKFQSNAMQSLQGGPLYSGWLFLRGVQTAHGPLYSDSELWNSLALALNSLPEKAVTQFKSHLPTSGPYTFTHGDLNICNVIVKDGNLVGILDWEHAGYFPVWWEYVAASIGLGSEDGEWKGLLKDRLLSYPEAKEFWLDFYSLHMYPDLDERGQGVLNKLMEGSD